MSSPKNITETSGNKPQIPNDLQIGDFVVARFKESSWVDFLPWEDWHHVGMISELEPYGRSYDYKAGPMVTPEDLADSPRSRVYFTWKKET